MTLRERFERVLTTWWFRSVFMALVLAVHFWATATMARERFGAPFNQAPNSPPAFANPDRDRDAQNWNRLAIARWDSGHYIGIALRGYSACPPGKLKDTPLAPLLATCDLAFYPGYPWVGRLFSVGGRIPIDYALLGVSLVASIALMWMWTSRAVTDRLGVLPAFLSLVLFNAYTSGFALVTIQTEPLFLALTLGAFVALDRRKLFFGALLAGAATGVRVSGVATGAAFALALAIITFSEPPKRASGYAVRAVQVALSFWGLAALLGFYQFRFGDPLIYFHAHEQLFGHKAGLSTNPVPILRSLDHPLHEGLLLLVAFIFLSLGMRKALRSFDRPGKAYWVAFSLLCLFIATMGQFSLGLTGMSRYTLHVLPLFFSMAVLMRRNAVLLIGWLAFSMWHYWQAELCFYSSGPGNHGLQKCNDPHWIGDI